MPLPHKKLDNRPDWVKRAGRRPLTKQEAAKVEARRVDALIAAKLGKRKPKPKPKPKPELPWYKKYNPFDILARGPLAPPKKKKD